MLPTSCLENRKDRLILQKGAAAALIYAEATKGFRLFAMQARAVFRKSASAIVKQARRFMLSKGCGEGNGIGKSGACTGMVSRLKAGWYRCFACIQKASQLKPPSGSGALSIVKKEKAKARLHQNCLYQTRQARLCFKDSCGAVPSFSFLQR